VGEAELNNCGDSHGKITGRHFPQRLAEPPTIKGSKRSNRVIKKKKPVISGNNGDGNG
jgi:hypothetical protein